MSNTAGSKARWRLDRFREILSRGGVVLTSIGVAGEATYPAAGEKLTNLKKINYLFGHNGCGKTTVSLAIHDSAARTGYSVSWKDGRAKPTLV